MDNSSNPIDEEPGNQSQDDNAPIFLSAEGKQNASLTNADPSLTPVIEKRNSRLSPLTGIIGVLIFGCCLVMGAFFLFGSMRLSQADKYFPSLIATATQTVKLSPMALTPTITPTQTPNLTATARILNAITTAQAFQNTAATAFNQWPIILSDGFDNNQNHWLVGNSDDKYSKESRSIEDGKYHLDTTVYTGFIEYVDADTKLVSDFYLSADVAQINGPNTSDFGLEFREDPNFNSYYFGINNSQEYSLSLYNNEDWTFLIDWTYVDAIIPLQSNRLTVLAEGDHFTLFINDQYIADVYDDSINNGTTALMIYMENADDQAEFEFDNFELRAP